MNELIEMKIPSNGLEKNLAPFFFRSGNTCKIAAQIHKLVGGDVFEIQPANDYPASYNDVLTLAKQEIRSGVKPELKNKIAGVEQYEIIFIGYPNWWNTFPAPVSTFLSEFSFEGKTIVPFYTHGGGGSGRSYTDITELCPGSEVLEGFSINGYAVNENNIDVKEWIKSNLWLKLIS